MKAHLTRRYRFSAAHRLHCAGMSAAENQRIYGKCNNPHGHGHNYTLEVTVAGPVDARSGMVCDLAELDSVLQKEILERFEHSNLNQLPEFARRVPTTENLCVEIFNRLQRDFANARVEKVRIEETMMNYFEYSGAAEPLR